MIVRPKELLEREAQRLREEVKRALFYSGEAQRFTERLISLAYIGHNLQRERGCSDEYAKGLQAFPQYLEDLLNDSKEDDEP